MATNPDKNIKKTCKIPYQLICNPWYCFNSQNKQILTVTYVFITNENKNDNLGIDGLPEAIFEMLVMENNKKPKLWFSIAQLLFTLDLQNLTLNVCRCEWYILIN